jgi:hypothetical protein
MKFAYTAATAFIPIEDITITREHTLADLLVRYEAELETAKTPSRTLLLEARDVLQQRLAATPLDTELMLLAEITYNHLGMFEELISLLRTFLTTPCQQVERAWAHWHLVDNLSLAEHYDLSVHEQRLFLAWALATLPPEDCFFVLSDGTQAVSWLKMGVLAQWFQHVEHLLAIAPHTDKNRLDRFYILRTAARLCLDTADLVRTATYLHQLSRLENEEALWSERAWVQIERRILELRMALLHQDETSIQHIVQESVATLTVWEEKLQKQESKDRLRFRSLQHNLGTPLYQAKRYTLALPFFQKAIAYQTTFYQCYVWLAACLWQTRREQEPVFNLLRQAASRFDVPGDPWETFRRLPELEALPFDEELMRLPG